MKKNWRQFTNSALFAILWRVGGIALIAFAVVWFLKH